VHSPKHGLFWWRRSSRRIRSWKHLVTRFRTTCARRCGSIGGFSSLLLEDHAAKLDPEGQDYLRRVRAAAERMGELIDDLLKLSQVGRAALGRRNVDVSALAHEVVAELQSRTPERCVQVLIAGGVQADADLGLLLVVLENLIGNAWKFTGTTVDPIIEFGAAARDGVLAYFVRDNGAGFDMAYVEKLFAPFQRLHSDAEFTGTGIGLATVRRIVERHGGRVWAEGAVGLGATFLWTLPVRAAIMQAPSVSYQ
jgi:light-regulated signal transduction histidine kinase (bacteriophytochrome)